VSVAAPPRPALLRLESVSKTFVGTRALRDVTLEILEDEVLALVGSNGSGKSTLIKTLAGYHDADPGAQAWFEGKPFDMAAVADARHERLHFVHQDLGLVLELGVMDNLALRHSFARSRFGTIDWREQARQTRDLLKRFELEIDIHQPMALLTPVQRVIVAIVAALQGWDGGRGVLVLDEPTAVLPPHEVGHLFEIVAEVRRGGASVLYVSHRLDEIFTICDRVAVLRGGVLVAVEDVNDLDTSALASLMVGEEVDAHYRADVRSTVDAPIALEARNVHARYLRGASIELRRGEIVGLAGLPGSGREEFPYALAGALGADATGEVRVPDHSDRWINISGISELNLPIVPADRAREAVLAPFSVRENLSLPSLDRIRTGVAISRSRESQLVHDWIDRLQVRTASTEAPISSLSGGNQQKVVIARCLALEPPVLFLCEPTAGVDIQTRIAIYDLVAEQARNGLAVVVSSTDIGDLLAMCSRVLVFQDGVAVREIVAATLSEGVLLHAMEEGAERA
jgi:ABC-type sugar transport system ATPase subunit